MCPARNITAKPGYRPNTGNGGSVARPTRAGRGGGGLESRLQASKPAICRWNLSGSFGLIICKTSPVLSNTPQPPNASAGITPACLLSPVRHVLLARRSHQHGFVVQLHPDKLGFIRNHLAGPCLSFRVIAVARISAFGISHAAAAVSAN